MYFFLILALLLLPLSLLIGTVSASNWRLDKIAVNHQIEGYVTEPSYTTGDRVDFHVSCKSGAFKADLYRMGWYGGSGAGLMGSTGYLRCKEMPVPTPANKTGLVSPNWPSTFKFQTSKQWMSGMYLAKLTGADGFQNYVPFVISAPHPRNPYLFVHSLNTEDAYNRWGGNSLYSGYTPILKIHRAVEVSFNRPLVQESGSNDGSGDFLKWEYPMVKFLDKYGYRCDYLTDVDIHEHPAVLKKYKTIIIAGHDEYWSKQMLDGYESAIKKGVNMAVFGANIAFRPIRFLPDPTTGTPDRVIVSYKDAGLDPEQTNPTNGTVTALSWREKPLFRPESELLGNSYRNELYKDGAGSAALIVNDDKSWVFKGTGLINGSEIPGVIGYEYDQYRPDFPRPSKVDILFHSYLINNEGRPDFADSTYYKMPHGGGGVFDAGTIDWSTGLNEESHYYNPKLVTITLNILYNIGRMP